MTKLKRRRLINIFNTSQQELYWIDLHSRSLHISIAQIEIFHIHGQILVIDFSTFCKIKM
ncbi:MAG: hypothetical protein C0631_05005 [Sedimenticola sp.]|nr:MAG: hypothetical protein C0631_05005 [Sedimenticola sp.]